MEYLKITKIENVVLHKKGIPTIGTLHLTTHHLIFTSRNLTKEFWVPYPLILSIFKNQGSTLLTRYKDLDEMIQFQVSQSFTKDKLTNQRNLIQWYTINDIWSLINIKIILKDYTIFSIDFPIIDNIANDVYDSLYNLTLGVSFDQLYAFLYVSNESELKLNDSSYKLFNLKNEMIRQGLNIDSSNCQWRFTTINQDYKISTTYPNQLIVPTSIPDSLITHCSKYRSKGRFPTLAYYYKRHGNSITRSAQPTPGITKQRSIQDEKLISTIFGLSNTTDQNLIVDARPLTNAIAQVALGGGTELMENYNFNDTTKRLFLGIDNIHIMSDTINSLIDNFLIDSDIFTELSFKGKLNYKFQNWIKYIKLILTAVDKLSKAMIFNGSNILVHCSDGWDRTAQIISLIQICIDPYFRTFEGFMILVEKDWVSFGHKFRERSHHLSSPDCFHDNTTGLFNNKLSLNDNPFTKLKAKTLNISSNISNPIFDTDDDLIKESKKSTFTRSKLAPSSSKFASPIFQQFLDCVYQLQQQNPNLFEFNERFLRRLVYHVYSCQYGTFLFNSEKESKEFEGNTRTRSVWDHFRSKKNLFINKEYDCSKIENEENNKVENIDWISPDLSNVKWWSQLYGRRPDEMKVNVEEKKFQFGSPKVGNELHTNDMLPSATTGTSTGIMESTREFLSFFSLDSYKNYNNDTA
ncbi:similar to Saccharomyces cerevisiae YJR110W YMR1 Phosphatidylinositol 3-phosphate (PI3P) phosphatase [Maudiozyma saulgeensis]|uniref:Similar to Saccharomyces cerevisiae YJR110W YMR1 Phosphatidylinositol 3-phosphate (PI3P) phosphatase n=1 Tax=Maudiozyma saulgeensis TaxID=1789683 RepID=A0A1X7R5W7_9SACH|nr:similar to Saccharomyces cerevisiae YJR110W YMR1 Phosphatidylinositol 3-phosphate (PI3P) phosphatase [Kazachstania saulgeensis]